MGQSKDDWIRATGGLLASPMEQHVRMRIQALAAKLQSEGLTDAERAEYVRLVNSLPDDEE
jgi:hypothetical protein